jgi:hypothetical protein
MRQTNLYVTQDTADKFGMSEMCDGLCRSLLYKEGRDVICLMLSRDSAFDFYYVFRGLSFFWLGECIFVTPYLSPDRRNLSHISDVHKFDRLTHLCYLRYFFYTYKKALETNFYIHFLTHRINKLLTSKV